MRGPAAQFWQVVLQCRWQIPSCAGMSLPQVLSSGSFLSDLELRVQGKQGERAHRVSGEERPLVDHLCEDAANGPDVHGRGVVLGSQQDLRSPVPQRDHLHKYTAQHSDGMLPRDGLACMPIFDGSWKVLAWLSSGPKHRNKA